MLKEIRFKQWKSFREAKLYIDPLTILVGTNGSGKSNALDGIAFLARAVQGQTLQVALSGEPSGHSEASAGPIRGGAEWAAMRPGNEFALEAVVADDNGAEYEYGLSVRTSPQVEVVGEYLQAGKKRMDLFRATADNNDEAGIAVKLYNGRGSRKGMRLKKSVSVISQLRGKELRIEVQDGIESVAKILENLFILDPVPAMMRDYKPLSGTLAASAANAAGVLAALPKQVKDSVEKEMSSYVSRLPEGEIQKVWAETVGRFKRDAMLYCKEKWPGSKKALEVDARGMSDGTLRFLGILTALLTRPENSLIIVEEVDNGLHPSRAQLLLSVLKEIGSARHIDILITTHNVALLDQLGPEMTPFVVFAHRSPKSGESQLTLLEEITDLPKLLALGSLGRITANGYVERSLARSGRRGQ